MQHLQCKDFFFFFFSLNYYTVINRIFFVSTCGRCTYTEKVQVFQHGSCWLFCTLIFVFLAPHYGCHHVSKLVGHQTSCNPQGTVTSVMYKPQLREQERWDLLVNKEGPQPMSLSPREASGPCLYTTTT